MQQSANKSTIGAAFGDACRGFAGGTGENFYCDKTRKYTTRANCIRAMQDNDLIHCRECSSARLWAKQDADSVKPEPPRKKQKPSRKCAMCKKKLPMSEFGKNKKTGKLYANCNECREKLREYHKKSMAKKATTPKIKEKPVMEKSDTKKVRLVNTNTLITSEEARAADLETNHLGGVQSKIDCKFSTVPPLALRRVMQTFTSGAEKYGSENYKKITAAENIDHAIAHLMEYSINGESEELAHASARALMALNSDLAALKEATS